MINTKHMCYSWRWRSVNPRAISLQSLRRIPRSGCRKTAVRPRDGIIHDIRLPPDALPSKLQTYPASIASKQQQVSLKENFDMTNHVLDNQDLSLESEKSRKYRKEDPTHEHLKHCYTFLREAILCSADTTLEPAKTKDGVRIGEYTAWEWSRECKDWQFIADFATEHQYTPWATEDTKSGLE